MGVGEEGKKTFYRRNKTGWWWVSRIITPTNNLYQGKSWNKCILKLHVKCGASVLCEILFAFSPVPHVTYAEKIMAVKIRIQTQIRPLPFSAEWQLTLLFSGSARTKLSSASKWILLARAKTLNSSEAWGLLAHPQALKLRICFHFLTLKATGINPMYQVQYVCVKTIPKQEAGF